MIVIKIADLPIGIDNRFSHIETLASEYLTDQSPVFTVSVTDSEIEEERTISGTSYGDGYYESIVAYRKIAEVLPDYDAFVFHGSVISMGEKAYVITANSGVGKTTHTRLWLDVFSEQADILNGDKPIIRLIDGKPFACGTPWKGKEAYGKNAMLVVGGIAFLSRSETNKAEIISPAEAATRFMSQIYLPKKSKSALIKTMRLADRVIGGVRLVSLQCNMEREAALVCKRALAD